MAITKDTSPWSPAPIPQEEPVWMLWDKAVPVPAHSQELMLNGSTEELSQELCPGSLGEAVASLTAVRPSLVTTGPALQEGRAG